MADEHVERVSGMIGVDPTLDATEGDFLQFLATECKFHEEEKAVFMRGLDAFNGLLLFWQFFDSNGTHVDGSAIMVGPGIAISAYHVLEPHLSDLKDGKKYSIAIGVAKSGVQIWTVKKATPLSGLDLVILGLELSSPLPSDRSFCQAFITTRLPKIGECLWICGFRSEISEVKPNDGVREVRAKGNFYVSSGLVTNRYPNGRDRLMLPWPVLEVDCPSLGGMSGGPVFDRHGYLVGLLCSSFSAEDGRGPSYISLLWPALHMEFEGGWPRSPHFDGALTLAGLANGICDIDNVNVVHAISVGGTKKVMYFPWE